MGMIGRESRPVKAWADIKSKAADVLFGAKRVGKVMGKASWVFGGPLMWRGVKYGWQGVKKVAGVSEWAGLTGIEGAKGVWGMTGKPLGTMALSVGKDIKRHLWFGKEDIPGNVLRGIPQMAIGLVKSPLELAYGVRDSAENLLKGGWGMLKDVATLKPLTKTLEAIGSVDITSFSGIRKGIKNILSLPFQGLNRVRKDVQAVLTPPVVRPLKGIITPPKKVVSAEFRSKFQYLLGIKAAGQQFKEGALRIKNAPQTARAQQAAIWQMRDTEAAKKVTEQQQGGNVTNMSDYKKGRGASKAEEEDAMANAA